MQEYLLLGVFCALMTGNTALTKVFQKTTPSGIFHLIMYNIVNALFACAFFAVMAKFNIKANVPTIIYSVIYALIICVNLSAQIIAFSKAPVAVVSLMSMAGGILLPTIFDMVYFDVAPTARLIISSILIIVAAVLPFVGKKDEKKGFSVMALLMCGIMFVLNGASIILLDLYADAEIKKTVCNSDSLFFLTNAAIVVICILALGGFIITQKDFRQDGKVLSKIFFAFTPLQLLNIVSKTALANLSSLVQMVILTLGMSAPAFSVLSSSILLVAASAVSAFIFREKQGKGTIFAVIFAIAAIIIHG